MTSDWRLWSQASGCLAFEAVHHEGKVIEKSPQDKGESTVALRYTPVDNAPQTVACTHP